MHCTTKTLLARVFAHSITRPVPLPPSFLIPSIAVQTSSFSTSPSQHARKDGNPQRGVSALRRTGLGKGFTKKQRQYLEPKLAKIPRPVLDPRKRSKVEVDEDHGLWEFFPPDRKSMATPEQMNAHGRAWTVSELRNKDWDDLHRLWWVCLKELNRMKTYTAERERIGNMYGGHESGEREKEIKRTMQRIRHTLTERWYAWENARNEAMEDDEINMYADLDSGEKAYLPKEQEYEPQENEVHAEGEPKFDGQMPPPDVARTEARV